MSLDEVGYTGRDTTESCDDMTGLMLQNPQSMTQAAAGLDSASLPSESAIEIEQTTYGQPFIAAYTVMAHADAGGDTLTIALMDPAGTAGTPNGPAPFKFQVLRWWVKAGDVAATPEGLMTIQHLSSASAASSMSAQYDLNLDADDVGYTADGAIELVDPYHIIDTGEGIQLSVVLGANEEADFEIYFLCMRVQ